MGSAGADGVWEKIRGQGNCLIIATQNWKVKKTQTATQLSEIDA